MVVPTESIYSNLKERGLRDLEDIEKEDIDEWLL